MLQDVVDRPPRQLDTIDAPAKERWERRASKQIAVPSDILIKKTDSGTSIPENPSHSRTLATLTETFTTTSEDQEDTTLNTSSMAYIDSFEVHEGLNLNNLERNETQEEDKSHKELKLKTKFSVDNEGTSRPRGRWPTDFYRRAKYNPPVAQRPLAAPSLFSSASGDSWEEQTGNLREVSLLDMVDSRDDEEEDGGHDGDDERDSPVAAMDKMRRMTMQFQQSHDDSLSPANHRFDGNLPKFAGGPLSRLHGNSNDDSKASFVDMGQTMHTSYSSSSRSFGTTPRNNGRMSRTYRKSVERVENEKSKNEESIIEKKGLIESLKNLIYCRPGSGE